MSDKRDLKDIFCYLLRPYLLYVVAAPNIESDTVYRFYSETLTTLYRCTIAFHCSEMVSLSDWTSGQSQKP